MEQNLTTENATIWSKLLTILAIVYVSSGAIAVLPQNLFFDLIAVLWLLVFIVLWLLFPVILYKDRKQAVTETEWSPSKAYYLGWLPGYIGIIAVFLYLSRRNKAYKQADKAIEESDTASQQAEDELDTKVSFENETTEAQTEMETANQTTETEYATTENTSYSVFDDEK